MYIAIVFRRMPKTVQKWEMVIEVEKWFLVFRWFGIMLWRLSPLVVYYFNWQNPYTQKFRFAAGIMAPNMNKGIKT